MYIHISSIYLFITNKLLSLWLFVFKEKKAPNQKINMLILSSKNVNETTLKKAKQTAKTLDK